MIKMPMSQDHRHRLEPMLHDQFGDTVGCIHSRIDDHALLAGLRRHQVAVGLPRPSRE